MQLAWINGKLKTMDCHKNRKIIFFEFLCSLLFKILYSIRQYYTLLKNIRAAIKKKKIEKIIGNCDAWS